MKKIYPWGTDRRFNAFPDYFKRLYGSRIQKVSVDAGFTCPNRDGTKSIGGCTFCNNKAFNPSYCLPIKSVTQQIDEGIAFHRKRYRKVDSYLAYFQAYSNTYASLSRLHDLYEEALHHKSIRGLVIGTRPDCVDARILDYLNTLKDKYIIMLEYGIESCYDRTLQRINRGHSFDDAVLALQASAERDLHTSAHFIFGLPGESKEEMLKEADIISDLPLKSVKFHQLQIIRGTQIEEEFKRTPDEFSIFSLSEYIVFITQFIERLNPAIVIERLTGEVTPKYLSGETWGKKRTDQIITLIENRLEEVDTWQGRLYIK